MKPPHALAVIPASIPFEIVGFDRWVGWRWESRGGKWTKVPVNAASGARASSDDPSTWSPFEEAVGYAQRKLLPGVGFVFTGSPFAGVDLDDCRDSETGHVEPWAREIVAALDSYAEVSPSGTGVKAFMRGTLPPGRRHKGRVEMYDSGRFFTVTGHRLPGAPAGLLERMEQLAALHRRVFGDAWVSPEPGPAHARPTYAPAAGTALEDAELVRRASSASNGEKFARLWAGDASGYAAGDNDGHSEADLALCSLLAFWCGPDEARIDALFRQSALCREKWTSRADYRRRTIAAALDGRDEFWSKPERRKTYARRQAVIRVG